MSFVVVNDCSHYFEDILPHLRLNYDVKTIGRRRGIFDKTVGIAYKILRSNGSFFTANYALQDAWLVRKLKHLNLLVCHGSDVRTAMNTRKSGWIVKGNLKGADTVAYTTADMYEHIEPYRQDAVYVPVPVKTETFTPVTDEPDQVNGLWFNKWYETVSQQIVDSCREHRINLWLATPNVPYNEMHYYLRQFQVYFDRQSIPSLSKTCLEAMSCGLAAVTFHDAENLENRIAKLANPSTCRREGKQNRIYVQKNHDSKLVANKIAELWSQSSN